jgi:eukaryotic-like serine/threonine-protein kinase
MADQSLQGTIIGNYVVGDQVGEGGMGVVYRAEHKRLPRRAAVKVLRPEASSNPELTTRFFNEAVAASGLDNAHVVEVLDYGELPDGRAYIVMEWLEGRSLADALQNEGPMPVPLALHVVRGICQALTAAHARGIVHRDLKPDNVFLTQKGEDGHFVKVLDFGVAKLTELASAAPAVPGGTPSFRTRTGIVIGTPAYMSPEQWRGANLVDHRSDIYSLGLIAYELLTGQLPCIHGVGADQVVAHVYEEPAPPSTLQPEVAPWLDELILKALAKTPDGRHGSMVELAQALEQGGGHTRPLHALPAVESQSARRGSPPRGDHPEPLRPVPSAAGSERITTLRGTSGELQAVRPDGGEDTNVHHGGASRWLLTLGAMAVVGGSIAAAVLLTTPTPTGRSSARLGPPPPSSTEALLDPAPDDLRSALVEPRPDAGAVADEPR